MFGFSCSSTCRGADPSTSTVKVDIGSLEALRQEEASRLLEEQRQREVDIARLKLEEEKRAAQLRAAQEAADARCRAEREERLEHLRKIAEAEEEERLRLAAAEAKKRTEMDAAARAAAEEASRLRLQQEERAREVTAFLQGNGFTGVNKAKLSMLCMTSTYPLHKAAELGDDKLLVMLLEEGADPAQQNSAGRTAAQVARKKDKKGSHSKAIAVLARPAAATLATTGGA
eukprot:TRINITY_DN4032_c0_g1_i2.p1 TRINITY_DN4032_c0_g1~~TRINITY_DN4032_c0_g1_i2.p1  ORF type:complete len:230 (+),score=73.67 TRINITY_DN4032_c0_g1_i2:55-744(+)